MLPFFHTRNLLPDALAGELVSCLCELDIFRARRKQNRWAKRHGVHYHPLRSAWDGVIWIDEFRSPNFIRRRINRFCCRRSLFEELCGQLLGHVLKKGHILQLVAKCSLDMYWDVYQRVTFQEKWIKSVLITIRVKTNVFIKDKYWDLYQ